MKHFIRLALFVFLSTGLFACGGGGGSSDGSQTLTGQFIDSAVAGLNYVCSSGSSGITNADGEFTCNVGDTVEFFLGEYSLGSSTAAEVVTPYSLYPEDSPAAVNVARLLQTIDTGSNPDGITVPADFNSLDQVVTSPTAAAFDADVEAVVGALIDGPSAQSAMNETILPALLSNQTIYWFKDGVPNSFKKWAFNADVSQMTWTFGGETGNKTVDTTEILTILLEPGQLGSPAEIVLAEVGADYLTVTVNGTPRRFYYDKTEAKTEYLKSILSGQTLYINISDTIGSLEQWDFDAGPTRIDYTELFHPDPLYQGGNGGGTVEINGYVMSYTEGVDSVDIVVGEVWSNYLLISIGGSSSQRLFFNRTDAENYYQVDYVPYPI